MNTLIGVVLYFISFKNHDSVCKALIFVFIYMTADAVQLEIMASPYKDFSMKMCNVQSQEARDDYRF